MGREDQTTMAIPPSDLEDTGTVPSAHLSFSQASWGHCDQPHSGGISPLAEGSMLPLCSMWAVPSHREGPGGSGALSQTRRTLVRAVIGAGLYMMDPVLYPSLF